jgi:serine/threonine protein kinase
MHLRAGEVFDRYTIQALLGLGGMGEVYRARDAKLERVVALKVLRVDAVDDIDPVHAVDARAKASAHILREARAAAAFEHVNVVAIHDVGEFDGVPFIAMELVRGELLREYIGDETVPLETRLKWLTEIGQALAVAHRRGLIHRDIKPENIMVRHDGVIKVLDFGIAHRQLTSDGEHSQRGGSAELPLSVPSPARSTRGTKDSSIMGTPGYMAPEQLRGERVDARSDQFAWGVLAYELLTGLPPWNVEDVSLTLVAVMLSEEAAPSEPLLLAAPEHVGRAVLRAISKDREDRFPNLDEALAAIALRETPTPSPPATPPPPLPDRVEAPKNRLPRRLALLVVLAASVLAFAALATLRWRPGTAAKAEAPSGFPPASTGPTRLIDLPIPRSEVPEAKAAYVAGMHALYAASIAPAVRQFVRATELDPSMAAAHLRLIVHGRSISETDVPAHFAKARETRALLSARDQDLLWAIEPSFLQTSPDEPEVTKRLGEIALRWPKDSELQYLALGRDDDTTRAEAGYQKLLELDPGFALALWRAANFRLSAGDYPKALGLLDRCAAVAPDSTACLTVRALVFEETGRCRDMETDARLLEYVNPSARTHDLVARVLFANGAPTAAVREALERKWAASNGKEREAYERDDESHLAILEGDFARAETVARASLASVENSADEEDHNNTLMPLIEIYKEMGKTAEAARLAVHYLEARSSWQSSGAWAPVPDLFAVAQAGGLRTAEERRAALSSWLLLWKNVDPQMQPQAWVRGYARPAVTPADGVAALLAAPHPLPRVHMNQFHREGLGSVGKVLLLAGRAAEALPELRTAAATCSALPAPIEHTHAHYYLAQALEQTGDKTAACTAYGEVLSRWGSAKPRSVTAEKARARRLALACPE